MDYSLQSLRDAFTNAAYKASRGGYKLYAVLLATTLDQQFLAEYLALFGELHALTGDDVLVMGVRPGTDTRLHETPLWLRDFASIAATLRHREDDPSGDRRNDAAERFIQFLHTQTAESYQLARFLDIRTDQFPAMVFFEDLERPSALVVWPLGEMPAPQFTRELRHLLEEVASRCAWREKRKLPELVRNVRELRETELREYHYSLPNDCREAAKAMRRLEFELSEHRRALTVSEKIDELRTSFAELQAIEGVRIPIQHVGETISDIEHRGFGHVIAHERRWRSRLPPRYRAAVAALKGDSLTIGFSTHPFPRREEIAASIATLTAELARLEAEHQAHRIARLEHASRDLERVKTRVQTAEPTFAVIQDILKLVSRPMAPGTSPAAALVCAATERVPRVFISYSHDSVLHAATVLELAQRLRGDGIDCWIDQFESSPAPGFPRWMQQEIGVADYVLLICTEIYCKRFNGAEHSGKGLGVTFEGHLILQELYDSGTRNDRFIPILFPGGTAHDVPTVLRASKWYELPDGYELLRRRLLGSDAVAPVAVGTALRT